MSGSTDFRGETLPLPWYPRVSKDVGVALENRTEHFLDWLYNPILE